MVAPDRRLFIGVALQPFVAAALAFVTFPFILLDEAGRTMAGGRPADLRDAAVSVALATGLVAFVVTSIGVVPAAFWAVRHRLSLARTLLIGLGFAYLPLIVGIAFSGGGYGFPGAVRTIAFASLIGIAGATLFWSIAIRGRHRNRGDNGRGR